MSNYKENISIFWNLTYRCNLNCKYCAGADYRNKNFIETFYSGYVRELRFKDMEKFLNILREGEYFYDIIIGPHNGESTLHSDFVKIWKTLCSFDSVRSIKLVSNGILLPKLLPKILCDKFKELTLSLDCGLPQINDTLRGDGAWEAVTNTIALLSEIKKEDNFLLQINTVVNKLNVKHLDTLPFVIKEYPLKACINVIPVNLWTGNGRKNADILELNFMETVRGIYKLYNSLFEINHVRKSKGLSPIFLNLEGFTSKQILMIIKSLKTFRSEYLKFEYIGGIESCKVYSQKSMSIDPYGNIFPCSAFMVPFPQICKDFMDEYQLNFVPNVRESMSIDEILNSKFFILAKAWIYDLYTKLVCNSCIFKSSCTVCPLFVSYGGMPSECEDKS